MILRCFYFVIYVFYFDTRGSLMADTQVMALFWCHVL